VTDLKSCPTCRLTCRYVHHGQSDSGSRFTVCSAPAMGTEGLCAPHAMVMMALNLDHELTGSLLSDGIIQRGDQDHARLETAASLLRSLAHDLAKRTEYTP